MSFIIQPAAGGNTQSMIAGGTITANTPVIINSSGQVAAVGVTANKTDIALGSAVPNLGAGIAGGFLLSSPTQVFQITATTAYAGTFASGAVTWGSGTAIGSGSNAIVGAVWAAASSRLVILFRGTSNYIYCIVGSVSGNTITFGTPVTVDSNAIGNTTQNQLAYNSTDGRVIAAWNYNFDVRNFVAVGTISGTSITFGTTYTSSIISGGAAYRVNVAYQPTGNKILVACGDNGFAGVCAVAATLSGTVVTFGAMTQFALGGLTNLIMKFDPTRSNFLVQHTTSTVYVFTITGATTVTAPYGVGLSTIANFEFLEYNSTDQVWDGVGASGAGTYWAVPINNTGAALVEGNTIQILPSTSSAGWTWYPGDNALIRSSPSTIGVTANTLVIAKNGLTNLTSNNYFGFATNAASLGGTVTVATVGAVAATSGLTAGTAYAIQPTGYFSPVAPGSAPTLGTYVGQAMTAATILIKG